MLSPGTENFYIEFGARSNGVFRRNLMYQVSGNGLWDAIARYNNFDVHATAFLYSSTDQESADLIGSLYFDLDNSSLKDATCDTLVEFEKVRADAIKVLGAMDALFNVPQSQVNIYFSGRKGFHILVPHQILGVTPRHNLNEIYKEIVLYCTRHLEYGTTDTQIYDRRRLLRIPNSMHGATGLYKIPVTYLELREWQYQDFITAARQPRCLQYDYPQFSSQANMMYKRFVDKHEEERRRRDKMGEPQDGSLQYIPPCIAKIEQDGLKEGQRNNTVVALASFYRQHGLTEDQALARARAVNTRSIKPSDDVEIEMTIRSIYSYAHKRYGCTSLKNLGHCIPNECRFERGVK